MPNLMNEFASNIIKHSDTFQSVATIRRDAKEIQNAIMGGARSASSRVNELKQRNVGIRSIYQWFKTNGQFGMDSTYEVDDDTEFGFSSPVSSYAFFVISSDIIKSQVIACVTRSLSIITPRSLIL